MGERFWLNDARWAAMNRCSRGSAANRATVPAENGPRTTLFNRWNRWSEKGIWQALLAALAGCDDSPEVAMVDSTAVREHRSAAGT